MKEFSAVLIASTWGLGLIAAAANGQQSPVNLGSDAAFAVLAGTMVTVTGAGTLTGDVGIFPGTAYVAGTPAVTVNGAVYAGGPVASKAQADLAAAYNDAAGRSVAPTTLSGNIGGLTLAPGLYKSTSSLAISAGNLTLDAGGNANAVWIFQIASTLTTTSGRQVILAGGASAANIFWQVGTSATIGTASVFQGNILAAVSISMLTGATISGRALAIGGAVAIDTGGGSSATIPVAPTAPTVTSTVPPNVAIGVPIGNKLSAAFSTPMKPSTITASTFTLTQGGIPVSGAVTYVGTTATFAPAATLAPQTAFTATITSGAEDLAGNPLAGGSGSPTSSPSNYIWSFTTGNSTEMTPPAVTSTVPAGGSGGAAIGNKLSATFNRAMDPSTITTSTFTLTQGIIPVSVAGAVTYIGTTATFAPSSELISSALYTATITTGAQDLSGNALANNYVWNFTTGSAADATPPTVISTVPASGVLGVSIGSDITAAFSKPMDPLTISTATFTLQQGATPVPGTVTYSGIIATFNPFYSLTPGTTYTTTVTNGARDLAGNALDNNYVWSFTTGAAPTGAPVISQNGTVNAASFLTPVAPGSIAAVFGSNLAAGQASSVVAPLPTTLAQSSFAIDGQAAPLFFANAFQVNLQVPWELAGQIEASLVASVNGVPSNTEIVPVASFAPGIFSVDASGAGQGSIQIAPTSQLAAPGSAVPIGGYIAIFCTGLGPVGNQPATGAAGPSSPLARTLSTPTVSIGGVGATVSYAGLAPTLVGVYQVNALVPAGVVPGNAVPVVIGIGNAMSNTVTIAVQ